MLVRRSGERIAAERHHTRMQHGPRGRGVGMGGAGHRCGRATATAQASELGVSSAQGQRQGEGFIVVPRVHASPSEVHPRRAAVAVATSRARTSVPGGTRGASKWPARRASFVVHLVLPPGQPRICQDSRGCLSSHRHSPAVHKHCGRHWPPVSKLFRGSGPSARGRRSAAHPRSACAARSSNRAGRA